MSHLHTDGETYVHPRIYALRRSTQLRRQVVVWSLIVQSNILAFIVASAFFPGNVLSYLLVVPLVVSVYAVADRLGERRALMQMFLATEGWVFPFDQLLEEQDDPED